MPHAETASRDRLLYVLVGALLFLSVLLRAWNLPLVHDEARTWLVYVLSGDFLPFRAQWDAGNHVLVTAIAWLARCSASIPARSITPGGIANPRSL